MWCFICNVLAIHIYFKTYSLLLLNCPEWWVVLLYDKILNTFLPRLIVRPCVTALGFAFAVLTSQIVSSCDYRWQ